MILEGDLKFLANTCISWGKFLKYALFGWNLQNDSFGTMLYLRLYYCVFVYKDRYDFPKLSFPNSLKAKFSQIVLIEGRTKIKKRRFWPYFPPNCPYRETTVYLNTLSKLNINLPGNYDSKLLFEFSPWFCLLRQLLLLPDLKSFWARQEKILFSASSQYKPEY